MSVRVVPAPAGCGCKATWIPKAGFGQESQRVHYTDNPQCPLHSRIDPAAYGREHVDMWVKNSKVLSVVECLRALLANMPWYVDIADAVKGACERLREVLDERAAAKTLSGAFSVFLDTLNHDDTLVDWLTDANHAYVHRTRTATCDADCMIRTSSRRRAEHLVEAMEKVTDGAADG